MAKANESKQRAADFKNVFKSIEDVHSLRKSTNLINRGMEKDIPRAMNRNTFAYANDTLGDAEKFGNAINGELSVAKMRKSNTTKMQADLYDIVKDKGLMSNLEQLMGEYDPSFRQLMKDIPLVKRCSPQIAKFIKDISNCIKSPDSVSPNSWVNKYDVSLSEKDREVMEELIKKYELNDYLDEVIHDYLMVGVYYNTNVPTSTIVDMLRRQVSDKMTENTGVDEYTLMENTLDELIGYKDSHYNLMESIGKNGTQLNTSLTESISFSEMVTDAEEKQHFANIDPILYGNDVLESIEFVNGSLAHYRDEIMNEAVAKTTDLDKSSSSALLKRMAGKINKSKTTTATAENLTDVTIDKIEKNVKFKGVVMEKLDPSRIVPFKLRNTLVGYYYVEDTHTKAGNQTSSIRARVNKIIYRDTAGDVSRGQQIEDMMVKTIGENMIKNINPKFIQDNMKDIDLIYAFIKENDIQKGDKRITFFHPDDVTEYRRPEGSILKNAMFVLKLWILTILTNTLANVTRGTDRTVYGIKTGLATDIEQHVHSAISAIKQNNLRYSDVNSIHNLFNVVGSMVDVFLPVSIDGERPLEMETISGQNIDMNTDFLEYLKREIVIALGFPPSMVDSMDEAELAKTLAMTSIDVAKTVVAEQSRIIPKMTKDFRTIVLYEHPDINVELIESTLKTPAVLLNEMANEEIDSNMQASENLVSLYIPEENETPQARKIRLFKKGYYEEFSSSPNIARLNELANLATIESNEPDLTANDEEDSSGSNW